MATAARIELTSDQGPRRSLGWGAGALVLGLALVGAGADQVGSLVVLAGLLLTIYAIHTYGRLGPDEEGPPSVAAEAAQGAAWRSVWRGGLIALAGVLVVAGTTSEGLTTMLFYAAVVAGAVQVARGARALSASRKAVNKVEKRRRLEKSARP